MADYSKQKVQEMSVVSQRRTRIKTYAELNAVIERFGQGLLDFVIVIGPGGVGKSQAVKKLCRGIRFLEGRLSAAQFYDICRECRPTTPICLSDIRMQDLKANLEQLRQLTDTTRIKTMHWNTRSAQNSSFTTASKLIILTNDWDSKTEAARALETRATSIIEFVPTAAEVHREVHAGGWFHDQEVFDFMQSVLHLIKEPNFRDYRRASELRNAGLPWEKTVLEWILGNEKMQKVAEIMRDPSLSVTEMAKKVEQLGICSGRTFYRLKKQIGTMTLPKLTEQMTLEPEPPQPSIEELFAAAEANASEAIAVEGENESLSDEEVVGENQNQCQSVSAIADKLPTKSKAVKKRGRPKKPR